MFYLVFLAALMSGSGAALCWHLQKDPVMAESRRSLRRIMIVLWVVFLAALGWLTYDVLQDWARVPVAG